MGQGLRVERNWKDTVVSCMLYYLFAFFSAHIFTAAALLSSTYSFGTNDWK